MRSHPVNDDAARPSRSHRLEAVIDEIDAFAGPQLAPRDFLRAGPTIQAQLAHAEDVHVGDDAVRVDECNALLATLDCILEYRRSIGSGDTRSMLKSVTG